MENMDLYSLASSPSFFHLVESEEDFPLGAKTTSFLPPATVTNASTIAATATNTTNAMAFDLPEWMEGREFLGLPDLGLAEDMLQPQPSIAMTDTFIKMDEDEEDYCVSMKPEDMLVPLSELKPPTTPTIDPLASTPPASPFNFYTSPPHTPASPPLVPASSPQAAAPVTQAQASAPLPKIIICRKVDTSTLKNKPAKVHYQVRPIKQQPQTTSATLVLAPTAGPRKEVVVTPVGTSVVAPQQCSVPETAVSSEVPQPCDAEELINEMVQMIGNPNTSTIFPGLDSEMEANMEELLLQLEASNKTLDMKADQAYLSVPTSSPSPGSFASLSPHPSEVTLASPSHSESTFPPSPLSLPSPVPSVGSLSPAQSTSDILFHPDETSSTEDCLDDNWSPLEETHSYSKPPHKARPSRRTSSSRKTPYPENRRERKKEQNKQAALRYRQKKKQEDDDLMSKVEAEEERQVKLKATYKGLKQELNYLKKLMREVFIAKGMLSEEALKKAALEKNASK